MQRDVARVSGSLGYTFMIRVRKRTKKHTKKHTKLEHLIDRM